jgi:phosphoribosylformimino-5-aminoimidazole carboxamide ribotide isomerase
MASTFVLMPAIDLRGGRVVRLQQGDFARATVFGDDPAAAAAAFVEAGARWLHVVDLDGARAGEPRQMDHVARIADAAAAVDTRAAVEAAGGIRSTASIDAGLASGARRVVLGTAALRDPGLVRAAVDRHGSNAIAVALDVRDGIAVGDAWGAGAAGQPPELVIESIADAGVETFEVTAIDRDGLLGGPDLALLQRLVGVGAGRVVASGGIRGLDDVLAVRELGCAGAIVGRALYDGTFDLRAALTALGGD